MKKRTRIIISVMLSLVILLGCIPLSVLSASAQELSTSSGISEQKKITEINEYRGENEKHFALPDGTIEAVAYPYAVHRLDSSGGWKDIDNSIALNASEGKKAYSTSDSRVSFALGYERNQELVALKENGYVISMALVDNQNEHISKETLSYTSVNNTRYVRPESFDTVEEAARIDNRASISYSDVMNETNIEYILTGNDIKENIVVKARRESYEYTFSLTLKGLEAELMKTGEIALRDKESKEDRYTIPAPYMYDSNDQYSQDVKYELSQVEGDKYFLTVIADEKWINDETREFPVRIDPSVQSTGNPADTYINSRLPNNNYGSAYPLPIYATTSVLINVNLPTVPSLATVNSGKIFLSHYMLSSAPTTTVGVYEILGSWSESTVKYSNAPSVSSSALLTKSFMYSSMVTATTPATTAFDVTSLFANHYNMGKPFYGIALAALSTNPAVLFVPREMNSNYAPYASVNYSNGEKNIYLITNAGSGSYLGIDDYQNTNYQNSGADIEVYSNGWTGAHQLWYFIYVGNGYYKIISVDSYLAITVKNGYANSSGAALIQETYGGASDRQMWSVFKTNRGNYVIRPKSGELYSNDWCMFEGLTGLGAGKIGQYVYTNDSNLYDEWVLEGSGVASLSAILEAQQKETWCWAAAARMFAKQDTNKFNQNKTQSSAATYVFNKYYATDNPDKNAETFDSYDIGDALRAINYYRDIEQTADYSNGKDLLEDNSYALIYETTICSESAIKSFLDEGQLIYLARTATVSSEIGHATLIYGYFVVDSQCWFLIRDPYPPADSNTMPGKTDLMSYQKMMNGQNAISGETKDYRAWDGFIIQRSSAVTYS